MGCKLQVSSNHETQEGGTDKGGSILNVINNKVSGDLECHDADVIHRRPLCPSPRRERTVVLWTVVQRSFTHLAEEHDESHRE